MNIKLLLTAFCIFLLGCSTSSTRVPSSPDGDRTRGDGSVGNADRFIMVGAKDIRPENSEIPATCYDYTSNKFYSYDLYAGFTKLQYTYDENIGLDTIVFRMKLIAPKFAEIFEDNLQVLLESNQKKMYSFLGDCKTLNTNANLEKIVDSLKSKSVFLEMSMANRKAVLVHRLIFEIIQRLTKPGEEKSHARNILALLMSNNLFDESGNIINLDDSNFILLKSLERRINKSS